MPTFVRTITRRFPRTRWAASLGSSGSNTNLTPGTGQLVLTGFAPAVAVSSNQNVLPGVGVLTLTGFVPVVFASNSVNVLPGVGVLSLTGFVPLVTPTQNQFLVPGAGVLSLTGFAPLISVGNVVAPGVGVLSLAGFAPALAVSNNTRLLPGTGVLSLTGFAPALFSSDNKIVLPGTGVLSLTGFAPAIGVGTVVSTGTGLLSLAGFISKVSVDILLRPDVGVLSLAGFAPTLGVTNNNFLFPGTGLLVLLGYVPTIQATPPALDTPLASKYVSQIALALRLIAAKGTTATLRHYPETGPVALSRVPGVVADDGHVDYIIKVVMLPLALPKMGAKGAGTNLLIGSSRTLYIAGASLAITPHENDEVLDLEGRDWKVITPAKRLSPDAKAAILYTLQVST